MSQLIFIGIAILFAAAIYLFLKSVLALFGVCGLIVFILLFR